MSDTKLYEEEIQLLIDMLPFSVFVALLSKYSNDYFLNRESDKLLYEALQNRKRSLSSKEMDQLSQVLNAIYTEDY